MIALNLILAAFLLHDPHGDVNVCNCDAAKVHGGWCQPHSAGYFAGLSFTSKQLADMLDYHGHSVSIDKTKCPTCRDMIRSDGYCDDCHMGFVDGKGYFSRLCYQIAKGKPIDPTAPRKPCCINAGNNASSGAGWCDTCKSGIFANRLYTDHADFKQTVQAVEVFHAAILKAPQCEGCAVAMVADARCPACKITYQNGKPAAPPVATKLQSPPASHNGPVKPATQSDP